MRTFKILLLPTVLGLSWFASDLYAGREMRGFNAILTPARPNALSTAVGDGFVAMDQIKEVPRSVVEAAVNEIFEKWNSTAMSKTMTKNFPNKRRIIDAVRSGAPQHARLDVLQVKDIRVLEQFYREHPSKDGSTQVMSRLSVSVRTQAVFDGPATGEFVRLDGTSDYIIRITQKVS